ncbi:amidohydrolase family protein [Pseudonocardia sp. DSM 110487]|uniref:amidohydrolase family protein n=1 Tax=Pseudonocardia sp. DSM 110487 TaxID=2865833 RepID=UPI0021071C73|nr:amidohydrolase family protein [Pseudonocardia sp. DSM 110487]
MSTVYDLVLSRGRVIDPESGLDAVRDVGIAGDTVREIGSDLAGTVTVDVSGLVVSPGFVDLHSHSQDVPGQRLQALDGVTTALELEAGAFPVEHAYRRAAGEGRPVNYGFSTSWAAARMHVLAGAPAVADLDQLLAHVGDPRWQAAAAPGDVDRIIGLLEADLAVGALGIGVLLGYAPGTDPAEYLAVAALAARHGVPTYTHARDLVEADPHVAVDGAEEIVRAAGETGAHMHYCHLNSTSGRHVDRVLALVEKVRREGSTVTTEAYPYGAGMTGIGAAFLAPELLHRRGLTPSSIGHLALGRRISDADELRRVREEDPGALAFVHQTDESDPAAFGVVQRALAFPDAAVASDAIAPLWPAGQRDPLRWPLPPQVATHPRTAGTFARTMRLLVRELGLLSLPEAVRRCTLVPARIVQEAAPAMRRKGRLQLGCDADVTVFDPETVSDRSTYTDTTRPSTGIRHVLVGGRFVVRDGVLDTGALPGRAVRGG